MWQVVVVPTSNLLRKLFSLEKELLPGQACFFLCLTVYHLFIQFAAKINQVKPQVKQVENSLATRDSQKRILADNLKLKQYEAQAAIRQKEMERMSEKMKNHDFDKVDREKRKINEHVSQLEREQSERTGRLGNY